MIPLQKFIIERAQETLPATLCASASTLATIAACGVCEKKGALAPINAIAHILHGDEALEATASTCSARNLARYTLPAIALNTFALGGWAFGFVVLAGRKKRNPARMLGAAILMSVVAYVVDYKIVPPRWTPGIEAHLSPRSMFLTYIALAVGLALSPAKK